METRYIGVIDIGKTNKKVLIFDTELKIVAQKYRSFEEKIEDGIHYEDVESTFAWIKGQLQEFSATYPISAISITTHGATVMSVDENGDLAVPPVAYTTDAGEEFREEFFAEFGKPIKLQRMTATAEIGSMVNVAKILYFQKKKWPEQFARIKHILYYPQYFGYLLTGNVGADPTYTGCHTYLYDFENRGYSMVARKLGVEDKLPKNIKNSWRVLGTVTPEMAEETGLSTDCIVTMGIHDSNASLLPYLVKDYNNFVLNSTGTWCVAMHPQESVRFGGSELGKLVFYNLDAFYNPVKTSIFMGGLEFDTYTKILRDVSGKDDFPAFNPEICRKVIAEKQLFIVPSVVRGTGIFPKATARVVEDGKEYLLTDIQEGHEMPSFFHNYETAFAVLNLSLALQTKIALSLAGFDGYGQVFTEGGFRRNSTYNPLLSSVYPEAECVITELKEATAFGAAICGVAALEEVSPMQTIDGFAIDAVPVEKHDFPGLAEYEAEFARLAAQ